MKKLGLIFMTLLLTLSLLLSACNDGDASTQAPVGETPSDSPSHTTEKTPTSNESEQQPTTPPEDDPHQHSYGEWGIVSEATCKKEGKKERACACGSKESEALPIIAHHYSNGACTMCSQKDPDAFLPDYQTGEANTVGNEFSMSQFASQADRIYLTTSAQQIAKINKDGTDLTPVYKVSSGTVFNLNVVGDWIYFYCEGSTEAKSYIAKVRTDGSGFEKIVSSVYVWDMLVVKETVFFTIAKWEYQTFEKECMPLYSVSVNGGVSKQIHDGFVSNITADANYVYFLHTTESGDSSIYRMKHDTTKKTAILSDSAINYFTLKNSKLYFLVPDPYSEEYTIASISNTGGSYTKYGSVPFYSEFLYVIGSNVYYYGSPYSADTLVEEMGLVAYNTESRRYTLIREDAENFFFYFTADMIIQENYVNETLTSLSVYNGSDFKQWNLK